MDVKRAASFICRLALALAAIYLSGCHPVVYIPGSQNVPLLKGKKEACINTLLVLTDGVKGPELQVAYAPFNNFGILLNGAYVWGRSENFTGDGRQLEAALGYFRPIGENFLVEVYGGAGQVKSEIYGRNNVPQLIERKYSTWFIQPAIGLKGEYFEIALSTKFSTIKYAQPLIFWEKDINDVTFSNHFFLGTPYPIVMREFGHEFFAIEPGLTVRGGGEQVKFQLQIIRSQNDLPLDYSRNLKITAGATFYLAPRFRQPLK